MRQDEGVSESCRRLVSCKLSFDSDSRSFKFTGPDGVEYRWALGPMGMKYPKVSLPHLACGTPSRWTLTHGLKLVTTDGKKTEIARFYRPKCFPKKQKARLEVHPAGMEMLDFVVLTFVIAETKRRARESLAKSGGG